MVLRTGQPPGHTSTSFNVTSSGDTSILAALTGRARITSVVFSVSGDVDIAWMSGTAGQGQTTMVAAQTWKAGGGFALNFHPGYFAQTVVARDIVLNLSGNSNVRGVINVVEVEE